MRRLFEHPITPRRHLLAALLAAGLLLPAASASAALTVPAEVVFEGGGSGWVKGSGTITNGHLWGGEPLLECHWNGTEIDEGMNASSTGPEPGVHECKTLAQEIEKGFPLGNLTIEHYADAGSKFAAWTVIHASIANGCQQGEPLAGECTVGDHTSITVKTAFEPSGPPPVPLTINEPGAGSGQVNCEVNGGPTVDEPCASTYPEGTELKLIAAEDPGSEFTGFENGTGDAETCSTSPCGPITLEEASELDAVFALNQRILTIDTSGGTGTGAVNCEVEGGPTVDQPCKAGYAEGTELKLIPVPAAHSEFAGYNSPTGSIPCTGLAGCEFTLNANSSVNAPFDAITHTLTVTTTGAGNVSAATGAISGCETSPAEGTCSGPYEEASTVELTAAPKAHQKFKEWSGPDKGACTTATSCEVTIPGANTAVTASFEPVLPLTIAKEGGEGTVSSNPTGIECTGAKTGAECEVEFSEGSTVTLTASPAAGYAFSKWKGCTKVPTEVRSCEVTMSEAETVTAYFVPTDTLEVNKAGSGSGTAKATGISCDESCSTATSQVQDGKTVKVTTKPAKSSEEGVISGATGSAAVCNGALACEFNIEGTQTLTVTFNPIPPHTLKVSLTGPGAFKGKVKGKGVAKGLLKSGISCGSGCTTQTESFLSTDTVTLEASASTGYSFAGWSGCDSEPAGKCEVATSSGKTVSAEFK